MFELDDKKARSDTSHVMDETHKCSLLLGHHLCINLSSSLVKTIDFITQFFKCSSIFIFFSGEKKGEEEKEARKGYQFVVRLLLLSSSKTMVLFFFDRVYICIVIIASCSCSCCCCSLACYCYHLPSLTPSLCWCVVVVIAHWIIWRVGEERESQLPFKLVT